MSPHKACADRREAIAGLVMGLLNEQDAEALRPHLASCEPCRRFYEALLAQETDLQSRVQQIGWTTMAKAGLANRPVPAAEIPSRTGSTVPLPRRDRRTSRLLRAGLAAAVLLAAAGLFTFFQPSGQLAGPPLAGVAQAAYGTVLRQIMQARSVTYVKTVLTDGERPLVMRQMVLEGGRLRSEVDNDHVMIDDFASGEGASIWTRRKMISLSHQVRNDRDRLVRYVDWMQNLHDREGVYAGQWKLEGRLVDVYKIDRPYEHITIWADADTNLPVRLEKTVLPCFDKDIRMPRMSIGTSDFMDNPRSSDTPGGFGSTCSMHGPGIREDAVTVILSDFAWNVPLDESLFSLTPPEGFEVTEKFEYGNAPVEAESLARALRFWAETSEGRFPENINMLADGKPNLVRHYKGTGTPEEACRQAILMMRIVLAGMFFAQERKLEDNWYYDGRNVTLGQADKPLAWWKDTTSGLWRVIYGDLHVRDLPADEPPPTSQPTP